MGVERLADHELLRARLPVSHRHVIAYAIAEYHLLRLFRRDMPAPLADGDDQFHFIIELLGHLRALHRIIWSVDRRPRLGEPGLVRGQLASHPAHMLSPEDHPSDLQSLTRTSSAPS